jgi:diadenosine tetraphosphatase ApaH/serine/threonine PP2A family protein phosphatase
MSLQEQPHNDTFVLFNQPANKGKWLPLISRLLNNESPRSALGDDAMAETLKALCDDAREVLKAEPVVLSIELKKPEDRVILVGDIHGQFRDMQTHILSVQQRAVQDGDPDDYTFLFLGDYVDRGPHGVEVMALLLALKVEYPNNVYIIRGNHEEAQTCRVYGFLQECRAKLDGDCWNTFVDVFRFLPLAAAVAASSGSFFCTHGGLSPHSTAIEGLQFLNREEYGDHYMMEHADSETMDGLMWSDPCDQAGYRQNFRGCGFIFGPDATEAFCAANNIQFVCRAHQMVQEGYKWDHDNRLLTLFSAPNYCGINDNRGAIAILRNKDQIGKDRVEFEFVTFDAAPASPSMIYGAGTASPSSVVIREYFGETKPVEDAAAGEAATAPPAESPL